MPVETVALKMMQSKPWAAHQKSQHMSHDTISNGKMVCHKQLGSFAVSWCKHAQDMISGTACTSYKTGVMLDIAAYLETDAERSNVSPCDLLISLMSATQLLPWRHRRVRAKKRFDCKDMIQVAAWHSLPRTAQINC